ncbi:heterokaryon incompatibility protein-domain-containing protein [Xylariaceae sp. FL1651]|nr:heterokaryon incompatibility protein-domain-containing protein [Xylariaceae sp. FL1651]
MRCAKCAVLDSDALTYGNSLPLHDNVQALKASAEMGCDFCTLCWTCCMQRHSPQQLDYLLQGLDLEGNQVSDPQVWLEGLVYPSRGDLFTDEKTSSRSENAIWISIGLSSVGHDISLGKLSVFADPGTPAASMFTETWTTVARNPSFHVGFARQWLAYCRARHKLCSADSGRNSEMPTRVIDVGDPKEQKPVHLVMTRLDKIQAPYIALSYCWGAGVQPSIALRDANRQELLECIDEGRLSRTLREALQLARELGFRYIWIDALCIIQGNDKDWEYESKRMAQVYGNAALTIIAGRAADTREGFLENRLHPTAGPCALPFYPRRASQRPQTRNQMGNIWAALPRSCEDGPTTDHGWCFQEAVLSSCVLVFAKEQLRFQCQEINIWEDGAASRAPLYRLRSEHDYVYSSSKVSFSPETDGIDARHNEETRRRMLIYWYNEILQPYSRRRLSNPADIFAAISGLAQVVQAKIRSRYLGGLWEVDMVRGLLWKPWQRRWRIPRSQPVCQRRVVIDSHQHDGKPLGIPPAGSQAQAHTVPVQVPSWSWASVQGQVVVESLHRKQAKYDKANFLVRPRYQGRWTRDLACHAAAVRITSCELEFFGRVRRVQCSKHLPEKFNKTYKNLYTEPILLVPMRECEADSNSDNFDHVIACGCFDVASERVETCWCLPLIKEDGLMLVRDEEGRFRRVGTMVVADLAWMMSTQEEAIRLV